ncbi:MAG: hypothetical protein IJV88_06790 [Ruminococcus sp.]|nr:hypothetical protein [Ruminococcus sp.]
MDAYCEQVVKRKNGPRQKILSGFLFGFFVLAEILSVLMFIITPDPFWIIFTFMIAVTAVSVLLLVLPRINNVDFDYTVAGNTFKVDKVINKRSRKKYISLKIGNIIDMGAIKGNNIPKENYSRTKDCSNGNLQESYYCIYGSSTGSKYLLIFSPNEEIIKAMRPSMDHELIMKLFYNKK